jgi:two-component system, LytTR family, sensor kinase
MSTRRRRWLRIVIPFALWSVPAVALTAVSMRDGKHSFGDVFLREGVVWYYWALITPLILGMAERVPLERLKQFMGIAAHFGAALLAGAVCGVIGALGMKVAGPDPEMTRPINARFFLMAIVMWCCIGLVFYSMVVSIGFALVNQERLRVRELSASRLEAKLVEAQLGALRMQLHPHFLFNTLNTIAMFVRAGDAQTATRLLARLSELLRNLLDGGGAQEVPLRTELEYARRYLDIEGARFSDRLRVQVNVPEEVQEAFVPNLLLQPLLENAIQHGIAARASAGLIELKVVRANGKLHVQLRNEGPGLPANWSLESARGIGLRNTALRLHHLYAGDAQFKVQDCPSGVEVTVSMPYHTTPRTEAPSGNVASHDD